MRRRLATTLSLAMIGSAALAAQPRLPRVPLPRDRPVPGVDRLLGGQSPVTTSLKDARTEVPWLDRLEPKFKDLQTLLNERGAFTLKPGNWSMNLQSFCLLPGTRGAQPTDGFGYLSAPLAGPYASIIEHMLRQYGRLDGIEQRDMQALLWAVLARTKIRQMPAARQALAVRLLTPAQIAQLESGALDVIPLEARRRIFDAMPPEARAVADANDQLRRLLTRAGSTYEELERAAVLEGPAPKASRTIPKQRWSIHPDGYFVRYRSSRYVETTVDIMLPGHYQIRRDGKGRIVWMDFGDGRRTETTYDDSVAPFSPAGNPAVVAYAFASIRLTRPGSNGRSVETVIRGRGWTFVTKRPGASAGLRQFGIRLASMQQPSSHERFREWKERFDEWYETYGERARYYHDRYDRAGRRPQSVDETLRDLGDIEHYRDGINAALTGDTGDRLEWLIENQERMNDALRRATLVLDRLPDRSYPAYAPSADAALPGSQGGQRHGLSSRRY